MLGLGRSVPGVRKIIKHTGVPCNEGGHLYGLFRGYHPMYPAPAACAYAACARELHHVEPAGQLELAPAMRAFRSNQPERHRIVLAVWSCDGRIRLYCSVPPSTRAVNSFGRLVSQGTQLDVPLSALPTYLSVSAPDANRLERGLLRAVGAALRRE